LLDLGPPTAVVTLGAAGAILATRESSRHFPAPRSRSSIPPEPAMRS
jgi:sugar/nucleoside kinase (ribokinase family)